MLISILKPLIILLSKERPIASAPFIRVFLMPFYRAYLLDKSGRASGPAFHLICSSDDEAIERARRLVGFQLFELWNVDRLVLRLEGRRGPSTDPTCALL